MLIELYIFGFSIIAYGIFITLAIIGLGRLIREKKTVFSSLNPAFISIVISARNEENNMANCIHELTKQSFDKNNFEIIIIDDASEDKTYEIADSMLKQSGLQYQIFKQKIHKGKKYNLSEGISQSKGSIIITSDADVIHRSKNWLLSISNYFETYAPNLLILPIDYEPSKGILSQFQLIENLALIGLTAGYAGIKKPFMCNGANLAFKKSAFMEVNGYQSHIHMASGDDVFLLEDIKRLNPTLIHYFLSREVIVKTKTIGSIKEFINQRIRWANKSKHNTNNVNFFGGLIVVVSNLILIALIVSIFKKSSFSTSYLVTFAFAKLIFDFLLLFLASNFLGKFKRLWWFIPFECIYWIYALIIGIGSLFIKPYWKEKKFN